MPSALLRFHGQRRSAVIAALSIVGIALHLILRFAAARPASVADIPLYLVLGLGGVPLVASLGLKLVRRQFGSDLLAGISIVASALLGQYLAGAIVVLMLSGGEALEQFAVAQASSALLALARRLPAVAHRRGPGGVVDVAVDAITVGDVVMVHPQETCPVDGIVVEGRTTMDESYLTGEPFRLAKVAGAEVFSGAINGDGAVAVRASRRPEDSRFAKIMRVMRESEQSRPRLRRLADRLGAVYTPVAVVLAVLAWVFSGDPVRFLAVLVVATPCPLLIGVPVAIIGSISRCARQGIVIKDPLALEQAGLCRTAIFDKTGTLTYGRPKVVELVAASGWQDGEVLALAAGLERFSRHPLAGAILAAAAERAVPPADASEISEAPGQGLRGVAAGRKVAIASRRLLASAGVAGLDAIPAATGGMECLVAVDGRAAGLLRFRDAPRSESRGFIAHLSPHHRFSRLMILSGDRESEVRCLAEQVGIRDVRAQASPEEKVAIVREAAAAAKVLYVGDGINDAPAMKAATVGIALGQNSDVTAEAADVVILESKLEKVDEFIHLSGRFRSIALQTAVGGMALSVAGMVFGATGALAPVGGAIAQEIIDVLAVANALRTILPLRLPRHGPDGPDSPGTPG